MRTRAGRAAMEAAEQVPPLGQRYIAKINFRVGIPKPAAEVAKVRERFEAFVVQLMQGGDPCAACGRGGEPVMTRDAAEQQALRDPTGIALHEAMQTHRTVEVKAGEVLTAEVCNVSNLDRLERTFKVRRECIEATV